MSAPAAQGRGSSSLALPGGGKLFCCHKIRARPRWDSLREEGLVCLTHVANMRTRTCAASPGARGRPASQPSSCSQGHACLGFAALGSCLPIPGCAVCGWKVSRA